MKVGIFVDSTNVSRNGGFAMKYDVLRDFCLQEGIPIRMNTYVAFDTKRAEEDWEYRDKQYGYFEVLRGFGYKVITKNVRWYTDEEGNRYGKASADLDMAVDIMLQARNLDRIFLLTGDSDFKKVAEAVQNMGCRVELIGFKNVGRELINECDSYTPGYIIPNLLPIPGQEEEDWGGEDFRVRGVVYSVVQEKKFGFLRYQNLAYEEEEVFFHFSELPMDYFVQVGDVLEFTLVRKEQGIQAHGLDPV